MKPAHRLPQLPFVKMHFPPSDFIEFSFPLQFAVSFSFFVLKLRAGVIVPFIRGLGWNGFWTFKFMVISSCSSYKFFLLPSQVLSHPKASLTLFIG